MRLEALEVERSSLVQRVDVLQKVGRSPPSTSLLPLAPVATPVSRMEHIMTLELCSPCVVLPAMQHMQFAER